LKALYLLAVPLLASQMLVAQTSEPAGQSSASPQPPAKQAAPAQPPAAGTITGHIILGDSHLPARMAYVTLLPANAADAGDKKPALSSATVQTGLDGAYVMNNILPGAYYVVAGKLGYATTIPISYLDPDAFDHAPKDVKEALAAALTPTIVAANRASRADIVLDKGTVISGMVHFDDGEPYSQAAVSLLRKEKSGKWTDYDTQETVFGAGARTDDQGNFRLSGLPAGDYLLRTTLELEAPSVNSSGSVPTLERNYRWDIYLGDGMRPRDARTIKLKDGEESRANDIEIPLAKLHSISGIVLSLETGSPVNFAHVELHNADDDSRDTATDVISASGQFRFPFLAEGEYTLKVTHAEDLPIACIGCAPHPGDDDPLRTYVDASQPLIVKGEMNGITITVKPQAAAATAAAQ
jgi:hypothetical protein